MCACGGRRMLGVGGGGGGGGGGGVKLDNELSISVVSGLKPSTLPSPMGP